jgi:hypothetical protein
MLKEICSPLGIRICSNLGFIRMVLQIENDVANIPLRLMSEQ